MKVLLLAAFVFISFAVCFPVAVNNTSAHTKIPSIKGSTTALKPRDEDPPSVAPTVFHSPNINPPLLLAYKPPERSKQLFFLSFFSLEQAEIDCELTKKTYTQLAITKRIRQGINYLIDHGGSWTVQPYDTTRPSCSWYSGIFVINEVSSILVSLTPTPIPSSP